MVFVIFQCYFPFFLLLIGSNHAEVINYGIYYNSGPPERGLVQDSIKVITESLNILDSKAVGNNSFSFQDGIEYLLLYGAFLRNEISNNFGQLIYNHYQELTISEIEALQKINLQILERKYNVFNLLPEIFNNGDLSSASVCRYMQSHISMCLKKYSIICMNVGIGSHNVHGNILNTTGFSIAKKIHQSLSGSRSNSNRFSATVVMKYLKIDEIKVTSGLFLGLLLNVQYDNLDHNIRTAERHVSQDLFYQLTAEMKKSPRKNLKKYDSLNLLVKSNLLNHVSEAVKSYAHYLTQHIYTKPTEVDEKVELLAFVYSNQSVNLKYLFELILPNDTLDIDVIEGRDYLRVQIEERNMLRDFLRVDKYQQTSPDQLLLDILMQIQELGFMTDIASALYTHALFWHQSHSVDNLGQLLELFNAFNNLQLIPAYKPFMETIHRVKDHLKDSLNTDIDIRCTRPRVCLKMGLNILAHCDSVDNITVGLIQQFLQSYQDGCDDNLGIETSENTPLVGIIEEKTSTLASGALETSTLATSSVMSTLEASATPTSTASRSTLASRTSTLAALDVSMTTGLTIESSAIQNGSSFPKEMNLVIQDNANNTLEDAALAKEDSSIQQINLTSSENGNTTQYGKVPSSENEKINHTNLNNVNSPKDQEDSSCESGEECGDDDTLATGDHQTTTSAPKSDPLVPEGPKKDEDSGDDDEGAVGINSDSVSCKLQGCYEQSDSNADDSAVPSTTHSPKADLTTASSDTTTSISVEYHPTQHSTPSTTTTSTTLRPKKRRKIICHHWNRHQRQKVNKSTAVSEVQTEKNLKTNQKVENTHHDQAYALKDVEGKSSEAKMALIDDDTLSQESMEKVYYQNSEYDDDTIPSGYNYPNKLDTNDQGFIENDSLGSRAASREVKNRLLDINTPKFFNFEIKRDETVSDYNTQKKRAVDSDESLDEDLDDRVLDWNSPKFFNFEIKRDETVIGDMHNNLEMTSLDSHDVSNTNNNGRLRRNACNKTASTLLKKNKPAEGVNVTNTTDVKNRLLDWNAQKFFNFEIKRDETVTTNHSRARRNANEKSNMTMSDVDNLEGTTEPVLLASRGNSSVINDNPEVRKSHNSSDAGIGTYLVGSGLAKLFNLDIKHKGT